MSGDFGPEVTVDAALQALKDDLDLHIILVGDEVKLRQHLSQNVDRLEIQHASEVVEMDDSPALALKKKKDSSMRVAINMVKEERADAAISAGNTGALMATARFVLKMLPGIERPAICTELPTEHGSVHMLDLGANVDSSPEMLLQFAFMGSELSSVTRKIEHPRIGLLNVGSEEIKGNIKVKAASELISNSHLNYVGYVEGDEIFKDKADVIVCDGFVGNICLKVSEGLADAAMAMLRDEIMKSTLAKVGYLLARKAFKSFKKRVDYAEYGGAPLLGIDGVGIICHGKSSSQAIKNALLEAGKVAEGNINRDILEGLAV